MLIFVIKSSGKLCTFCYFFVDEVVVGAKYIINKMFLFFLGLLLCKNDQGNCAL